MHLATQHFNIIQNKTQELEIVHSFQKDNFKSVV